MFETKNTRLFLAVAPSRKKCENIAFFFVCASCLSFDMKCSHRLPFIMAQSVLPWISAEMLTNRCTKERASEKKTSTTAERCMCMAEAECRKWFLLFLNYFVSAFIKFCDLKNLLSHCYPVRFRPIHSLCAYVSGFIRGAQSFAAFSAGECAFFSLLNVSTPALVVWATAQLHTERR